MDCFICSTFREWKRDWELKRLKHPTHTHTVLLKYAALISTIQAVTYNLGSKSVFPDDKINLVVGDKQRPSPGHEGCSSCSGRTQSCFFFFSKVFSNWHMLLGWICFCHSWALNLHICLNMPLKPCNQSHYWTDFWAVAEEVFLEICFCE